MKVNRLSANKQVVWMRMLLCSLTLIVLFSSALTVHAQNTTSPERGFQPSSSYAIGDIETINTTNGNLMLHVPLGALPAGRGGLAAKLTLLYNSKLWDQETIFEDCPRIPHSSGNREPMTPPYPECSGDNSRQTQIIALSEEGGWRYAFQYKLRVVESFYQGTDAGWSCNAQHPANVSMYKLQMVFPDGSSHDFRLQGYTEPDAMQPNFFPMTSGGTISSNSVCNGWSNTTNKLVYYSVDGTYSRLEFEHNSDGAWTLYLPDGTRVTEGNNTPQRIYDRNNNYIEIQEGITYNNHPAGKLIDQLGRQLIIEYGSATDEDTVHMWSTNNQEITWRIKWKNILVRKTYNSGVMGLMMHARTLKVVDQVILPAVSGQAQALSYTFGYNASTTNPSVGWGEVSSVTLPSGAQTTYQYKLDNVTGMTANAPAVLRNSPTRKELTYQQEYDGASTPVTEAWTYAIDQPEGLSTITAPDGGITREYFLSSLGGQGWSTGLVYKSEGPDGSIVERKWLTNNPYGYPSYASNVVAATYIKTEYSSIKDLNGNYQTAIKDYNYDKNGNVTQVREYDWVPYASVHDGSGNPLWNALTSFTPKRVTTNTYHSATPDATDTITDDPDSYHKATAPRILNLVASSEVGSNSQTFSRSEFTYDNALLTGNLTEQKSWDSMKGPYSNPLSTSNSVSVSHQYDVYGNPTISTDAQGIQSKLIYGSVGGYTDLYPTQTITAFGTSVQRTASQVYDFNTGLVTSATDADNNVTNETDYDVLGRPVETRTAANIPGLKTVTRMEYSDDARRVITRSDLSAAYDGKLVSIQHYDQIGRVRLSRKLEDAATQSATDETTGIKVQARYLTDVNNHFTYQLVSNPYRAATSGAASAEATMGWTRSKSDNGGRVIEVGTFSGSSLPAPWGTNAASMGMVTTTYDANYMTVTDQAGKVRRSKTNALGQLVRVDEPNASNNLGTLDNPTQPTSYTYDALGNLTQVSQDSQTRTFTYSSLSRLTSATNPEAHNTQGVAVPTTYQYDHNGNLTKKTDARGITIDYVYDALNRITFRDYPGTALDVTYTYDTLLNGKGRLTSVVSSVSTTSYGEYDALGRIKQSSQTTNGQTYSMSYGYNLAGAMTSQTYPSGRVVTTSYDNAGRLSQLSGQKAGETNKTYVSQLSYSSHGAITGMKMGNNLWEHTSFNTRLQPTEIGLGTQQNDVDRLKLSYAYGTTANNGNVQSQTIIVPGGPTLSQSYTYDELNRLKVAVETNGATQSWKQSYAHDRYGNRTFDVNNTTYPSPLQNPAINQANNRIAANQGYSYDYAGNLLTAPNQSFTYDEENRIASYNGGNPQSGGGMFSYDGDGRRVKKITGSGTTVYVYNALGQLVAEYTDSASPQTNGGVSYLTSDTLGTPRVITNADGSVKARHDYLPFGEEIMAGVGGRTTTHGYSQADNVQQKFTSKERDSETGLDYFGARYYFSTQGRFTSVDPLMASARPGNPQTWNRYSYTWNNPINLTDPLGLDPQEDDRSFTVTNPCQVDGTSQCGPAFNMQVTVTIEPDSEPIEAAPFALGSTIAMRALIPLATTEAGLASPVAVGGAMALGSFVLPILGQQYGGIYQDMAQAWATNGGWLAGEALLNPPNSQSRPIPLAPPLPSKADPLQTVFRVFGGESQQAGFSWTPIDPRTVPNYRDAAGLPPGNSGNFLVAGEVRTPDILTIRPAIPIPPNKGGLTEYIINPASVINQRVTPLVPPL